MVSTLTSPTLTTSPGHVLRTHVHFVRHAQHSSHDTHAIVADTDSQTLNTYYYSTVAPPLPHSVVHSFFLWSLLSHNNGILTSSRAFRLHSFPAETAVLMNLWPAGWCHLSRRLCVFISAVGSPLFCGFFSNLISAVCKYPFEFTQIINNYKYEMKTVFLLRDCAPTFTVFTNSQWLLRYVLSFAMLSLSSTTCLVCICLFLVLLLQFHKIICIS